MPERGGRWLRISLGVALALLAVLQIHQVAQAMQSQGRLRAQVVRAAEGPLRALRPQWTARLAQGEAEAWMRVVAEAAWLHPTAEVELFDASGETLAEQPRPAPVRHFVDSGHLEALETAGFLTMGPLGDGEPRLLTYGLFPAGERRLVLRVALPVPELIQELRERRQALVGHAFVVLSLVLAAVLVLSPVMEERSDPGAGALAAYAEALTRLRQHGLHQSEQHEEERQRLEERIRDAEPMARAGELTTGIVHEVRNGLGTILGYARLIEREAPGEPAREAARGIAAECETLEKVVRRFIEFVRAERLELGPVELRRLLSRVASHECGAREGAAVAVEPGEELEVLGDEELLERAFENLVRNAREAAGGAGHVWLRARRQDGHAAVTVSDDGPGLPPERADLLKPFQTTKPGGLGLGLPLVMKIVTLHGGDMTLAPRVPTGLEVTVWLLLRTVPPDRAPGTPPVRDD